MRRTMAILTCLCMALCTSTAFADVAGSSFVTGSWGSTGSYTSTITLSDPGGETEIKDITVGVDIDHSWSSDVSMTLSDGTNSVTFNANQGDSSNWDTFGGEGGPAQGTYFWNDAGVAVDTTPDGASPLIAVAPPGFSTDALLNGAFASTDATWTLTVSDGTAGDGGFVGGWSISIISNAPAQIPEPTSIAVLGLFGTVALMRRRKR